jgi:hypothetical protein
MINCLNISFIYLIVKNSFNTRLMNSTDIKKAFLISITLGLFWSSAPLIGWSNYGLESNLVSCSIELKEKSLNVITYNICAFLFVFIIPFSVIIFTNIKTILIVYI